MVQAANESAGHREKTATLVVFLSLLFALLFLVLWMIGPYFLAILAGGILSLMARPAYKSLCIRGIRPKTAAGIVTISLVLIAIVPGTLCLTVAVKQAIALSRGISTHDVFSIAHFADLISQWTPAEMLGFTGDDIAEKLREWVQASINIGTSVALGIAGYVPRIALQLTLAIITCFFFLTDGPQFISWFSDRIPLDGTVRTRIASSFRDTAISSIWATFAASGSQSIVIFLGYLVLGVPSSFLAGAATFILAWVPVIGSTPVWVIAAGYLYSNDMIIRAAIMVVIGFLAGITDNIVRPVVLGGRSDLHPLVSLIAIIGGVGLFGILGVFLGPIATAVLTSLLQVWPEVAAKFGLLPDRENTLPIRKNSTIEASPGQT
jgi:predicted PurR-regulated permease PerM